jgi:thiol-disulfide isomerase/thioredoxin
MKRQMKKVIYLIAMGALLASCSNSYKANKYLEKVFNRIEGDYISFDVEEINPVHSVGKNIYYSNRKDSVWANDHVDLSSRSIYYQDSFKCITLYDDKLYLIQKKEDMDYIDSFYFYNNPLADFYLHARYVNLYLFPDKGKKLMKSYYQNVRIGKREDKKHKVISFEDRTVQGEDSLGNSVPRPFLVKLYVNDSSKLIEKIESKRIEYTNPDDTTWNTTYYLSNISFDNKDSLMNKMFDFNNKEYSGFKRFSRFNDDKDAVLDTANPIHKEKSMLLTDEMLNASIISLNGDTTTIGEKEGWIFVDFWFIGCKPCMSVLLKIKEEKQKYGYALLEKEGVRIMLINPESENLPHIKKFIAQYDVYEYVYASKALKKQLNITYMPQYFLISPNKTIYRIDSEKPLDYSEILKIIKK